MEITASGQPALDAAADHLLIFATKDDDILDGGALRQLNEALDGGLVPLVESGELSGAVNETVVVHTFGRTDAPRVVIAGLGPAEKMGLDEIRHAAANGARKARSLSSGALAVAGLKKYAEQHARLHDQRYVAVVSGANVNFDRLRHISERAELGEHREVIFGVTIEETRGSFRRFCHSLGQRSVTEFNYRYAGDDEAHVYVGLQIATDETRGSVAQSLRGDGYRVTDLTDNEAAKLHVRHMVGGRGVGNKNELLYRFEFPERPGALLRFLNGLGSRWNITLFHYRNHGAAWGRVLAGFEARPADRARLSTYLDRIGYRYWEETGNPAVELFLR